jgi:hypothetical protein
MMPIPATVRERPKTASKGAVSGVPFTVSSFIGVGFVIKAKTKRLIARRKKSYKGEEIRPIGRRKES